MNGDLAELLNAAETGGVRHLEKILTDDEFVGANREKCIKATEEMFSVLERYTNFEASTMVRSVTELDGVEAWARLHANCSSRTLGTISECDVGATSVHVPKASKRRESSEVSDHAVGREVASHDVGCEGTDDETG